MTHHHPCSSKERLPDSPRNTLTMTSTHSARHRHTHHSPLTRTPAHANTNTNTSTSTSTSTNTNTNTNTPHRKHSTHTPQRPAVSHCKATWMRTIQRMHEAGQLNEQEVSELSSHILSGVSLTFMSQPSRVAFRNTPSVDLYINEVRQTLAEYMAFGAVERLPDHPPPTMIQPLHVVIKPMKAPRLVIDLSRNLNQHLPYTYFSYSNVTTAVSQASQGCWFAKLDISKCYLSLPINPEFYDYFTFSLDGKYYRFTGMPFGLATAPRICTQLLGVVAWDMEEQRAKLVRYLDDFLFIARTREECQRMLDDAIATLARYGLVVNQAKTAGPSQVITFLGIELDSINMTMQCTRERLQELIALLQETFTRTTTRVHQLESLIGKLSFAAMVLPGARPFMRRLLDQCRNSAHRSCRVRLGRPFFLDVSYWLAHLKVWNGRQAWRHAEPIVLVSDASLAGFGFYLEQLPSHLPNHTLPPTSNSVAPSLAHTDLSTKTITRIIEPSAGVSCSLPWLHWWCTHPS